MYTSEDLFDVPLHHTCWVLVVQEPVWDQIMNGRWTLSLKLCEYDAFFNDAYMKQVEIVGEIPEALCLWCLPQ